jgi:hypothetical protein
MSKKGEEEALETIVVERPIKKDGDVIGWKKVDVPKAIAEAQLAKDPAKRHPHWRQVRLVKEEAKTVAKASKPKPAATEADGGSEQE